MPCKVCIEWTPGGCDAPHQQQVGGHPGQCGHGQGGQGVEVIQGNAVSYKVRQADKNDIILCSEMAVPELWGDSSQSVPGQSSPTGYWGKDHGG